MKRKQTEVKFLVLRFVFLYTLGLAATISNR